jgi:hypothetical protein
MIVSNRKLFKKRPARDNLNEIAGIMASSPELMNEVQRFDNGGNVQLPGSVGSIVQLLDAVKSIQLPELTVRPGSFMDKIGASLSGKKEVPLDPDEIAARTSAQRGTTVVSEKLGERGYAVFRNGSLVGYQSVDSAPSVRTTTINRRDIDPKFAYDRGVAERIGAMDKSTPLREDAAGLAEGIAGLLKTPITTIKDMTSDLSNYFFGPSVSAKKDIDDPTTAYPTGVDIGTIADDVGRTPEFTSGQITRVKDPEGFRDLESSLLQGSEPMSDPEEIQKMIDAIRIGETEQALKEKRIREGEEATERMKGPVPPTTDLGTRLERVKAERDAIEAKEQQDDLRARLAGQTKDVKGFTDPTSLEEVLNRRQITNEMGGIDPRVDMPPGAFPKGTKQPSLEQPKPSEIDEKDTETFDAMGDIADPNQKQNFGTVNQVVQQTTGTDIKSLMEEFTSQAPEYEGMNKGMAIAKIGFAMAAGQSPNALTNIANALSMGADMFLKDDKEKQAFNRQIKLAALQYGLGEISKERAQARSDARSFQQFVDKDGNPVLVPLSEIMKSGGLLPEGLQYKDLFLENVKAADEKLKAILDAKDKLVMSPSDQRAELELYEKAVVDFQQSTNMVELTKKLLLQVNDEGNKINTLGAAFKDVANKAFQAAGIKTDKKYKNLADFQADLKIAFQALIPLKLGKTQSANSISDRDVDLLAQAYFGAAVLRGGSFDLVGLDSNVLTKKLQTVLGTFEDNVKGALNKMTNSEKFLNNYLLADRKTPVSTRLKDFTPKGVKDITDYSPNLSYDEKTNTYIVRVGEG